MSFRNAGNIKPESHYFNGGYRTAQSPLPVTFLVDSNVGRSGMASVKNHELMMCFQPVSEVVKDIGVESDLKETRTSDANGFQSS